MESKIHERKKEHKNLFNDSLSIISKRIKENAPKSNINKINLL